MARTTTAAPATPVQTLTREQAIQQMMERLRQPASGQSFLDRITDKAVDVVADGADTISRFGAAVASSFENASDAYAMERERQLFRRASKAYDKAARIAG